MAQFPIFLPLGPIRLPSHLLFDILAYYIGAALFLEAKRRHGDNLPPERRQLLIVAAIGGALFGSTFLGALEHRREIQEHLLFLLSAKTIVGGLLGGLLAVESVKKIIGERRSSGDLLAVPLALAIAVGRIGCFLTGVGDSTVGAQTALPWAMDQGDGVLRHPAALYEILFLVVLSALLMFLRDRRCLSDGARFRTFLVLYCGYRFVFDFLKPGDPLLWSLSAIQVACGLFLLWSVALLCFRFASELRLRADRSGKRLVSDCKDPAARPDRSRRSIRRSGPPDGYRRRTFQPTQVMPLRDRRSLQPRRRSS